MKHQISVNYLANRRYCMYRKNIQNMQNMQNMRKMKVIVKHGMFYVVDCSGSEKACFKSFKRLAEYLIVMQMCRK